MRNWAGALGVGTILGRHGRRRDPTAAYRQQQYDRGCEPQFAIVPKHFTSAAALLLFAEAVLVSRAVLICCIAHHID
jgi:hypothetical protein